MNKQNDDYFNKHNMCNMCKHEKTNYGVIYAKWLFDIIANRQNLINKNENSPH